MKQQITVYNSEDFEEKHQDFIIALKQSMKKVEEFYNEAKFKTVYQNIEVMGCLIETTL